MKTKAIVPTMLILILLIAVCKKGSTYDSMTAKNLSVSDCKSKGDSNKGTDSEYITLKTVDDSFLNVTHINSVFCCQPGKITVSIKVSGNEISFDENESTSLVNCVCPYDINFKLGPLQYVTYILKFQKGGQTFKEYSFDFKATTDVKIDL